MKSQNYIAFQIILVVICFILYFPGLSQNQNLTDSVVSHLQNNSVSPNERLDAYVFIAESYSTSQIDKKIKYCRLGRELANELNRPEYMARLLYLEAFAYRTIGIPEKALELLFKGAEYAIEQDQYNDLPPIYSEVASCYELINDEANSLLFGRKSVELSRNTEEKSMLAGALINFGYTHYRYKQYDSALAYYNEAEAIVKDLDDDYILAYNVGNRALVYWKKDSIARAKRDLFTAIEMLESYQDLYAISDYYIQLGNVFLDEEDFDHAKQYAKKGMIMARTEGYEEQVMYGYDVLFQIHKAEQNFEDALKYQLLFVAKKDSIQNLKNTQRLAKLRTAFEVGQKQVEIDLLEEQKKNNQIIIVAGGILLIAIVILVIIIFRSLRTRTRFNRILRIQKEELVHKAKIMEKANEKLRKTQTQLIHSEKMASLGELTAGIAHEIQNPLNFVNNFSDINKELIEELKDAVAQNDQGEVNAILSDLTENEGKINHHGKRAEEIVKSMLQHSRTSSGEKELTDINVLADEYLRLAYHGLRAKDNNGPTGRFNADFKCTLDENLPKVKVIPQDIGRVLLNLINNAFQATSEKLKTNEKGYMPSVEIVTIKNEKTVNILIKDNGPGVPDELKEKIFQPFFTTKPTGSGTGLGLSLSYDIITKGHGGEMTVESEPGEGSTFKITLNI